MRWTSGDDVHEKSCGSVECEIGRFKRVIWAWIGAVLVGVSLGLLGSGGAILTVPILVYLVGHDEKSAIAESLAIVGIIALVGAVRAWRRGQVDVRSLLLLAIPGMVGTTLGAWAAGAVSGAFQLALLGALMLVAALRMLREPRAGKPGDVRPLDPPADPVRPTPRQLVAALLPGLGLGFITGLVGVGGGFLIVPVLVLIRRLPMPAAVGTSLAIIAINSGAGFAKYALTPLPAGAAGGVTINAGVIGVFAALGIVGSVLGAALAGRLHARTLRRVFAVFLLVMGVYIGVRQGSRLLDAPREPAPTVPSSSADGE